MINQTDNVPSLQQLALFQSFELLKSSNYKTDEDVKNVMINNSYKSYDVKRELGQINHACKSIWDSIKIEERKAFGSNQITENIEESLITDYCYHHKTIRADLNFDKRQAILTNNITKLFISLNGEFNTTTNFASLLSIIDQCEEKSLFGLHDRIKGEFLFDTSGFGKELEFLKIENPDAVAIREWLVISPRISEHLNNLKCLSLAVCNIFAIPSEIKYFSNLIALDLSRNKIKYIPDVIGNLSQLQLLDISDNRIEFLPNSIFSCENLKILKMKNNKIKTLSDCMIGLTGLVEFDASNNRLTSIPSFLISLKKLTKLFLLNNPLFLFSKSDLENKESIEDVTKLLFKAKVLNEYQCFGKLSCFFQRTVNVFIIDRPDVIKKEYNLLNKLEKLLILSNYNNNEKCFEDLIWKNKTMFDEMMGFCQLTISAVVLKFALLSNEQQQLVYNKFNELGQNDPFYNLLMLDDVMDDLRLIPEDYAHLSD